MRDQAGSRREPSGIKVSISVFLRRVLNFALGGLCNYFLYVLFYLVCSL
ncbi:hypothetical protein QA634_25020 [Methylobacterium sp. CB376]|nr:MULTISPECIES: hypothetical protein [Methylobacterium]WFT78509.1 hypothetical protein QA634_25020 [Methylobacterium nodulans]